MIDKTIEFHSIIMRHSNNIGDFCMTSEEKEMVYKRNRSVAIVVRDGKILMEKVFYFNRYFYTVPGGGIEEGETPEDAVVRELKEETGLSGIIIRPLAVQYKMDGSAEYSFEMSIDENATPILGYDPEEADVPVSERALKEVCWLPLEEISEKDRAFLWSYGLITVGDFFQELVTWGDDISYPKKNYS